ncbi:MAG: hypothetical protein ACP5IB_08570 [Thermoplasmata archaeon]|jgi:Holliday junction resolvase
MGQQPKNVKTGKRKEKDVVRWLENHGWEIKYEGGRGPADIIAIKDGKKWLIQVKYTRKNEMDISRFRRELDPLINMAEKQHGTAVLCFVIRNSIWFDSAKTWKNLARGFLRK